MHYKTAGAFRQALESRLKVRSGRDGARLARLRKQVAFDRLLARLAAAVPNDWLLKGGCALELRLADRARTTMDVDLAWVGEEEELLDRLIDAVNHDPGDFFQMSIERLSTEPDRLGGAHRFRVTAMLAGRQFDTFHLDLGVSDAPSFEVEYLQLPDLMSFAGIEAVAIPATTLTRQAAEKVHAYTRRYDNARPSTRTKDLVDLALIAHEFSLDAAALSADLGRVFATRATHELPTDLPSPPGDWRLPYRRMATEVGIDPDLDAGHVAVAAMLNPVLRNEVSSGVWSANERRWRP